MKFKVLELSLEAIRSLRKVYAKIKTKDPDLARQLVRAASSLPQNISEGGRRVGKDRLHLFRVAAGSGDEARTCLRIAEAWGYVSQKDIALPLEFFDRMLAMLWRLTN